jgi:nicotinamidase/pyrazinamidase
VVISLTPHDALLVADIQNDFLPGGALGIPGADAVLPVLQAYLRRFEAEGLPIFLTRDWHPPRHCSFREQGGPWPPHCVAGTPGSLAPADFYAPAPAVLLYKAIDVDREAYSAFQDTALHRHLQALGVRRLFIGGLATDYCVLNSVKDLMDGIKAVEVRLGDGRRAEEEMLRLGAVPVTLEAVAA